MAVASTSAPKPWAPAGKLAVGAVLAAVVGLVVLERLYRELEIRLAGLVLNVVTSEGVHVVGERETVYFGLSGENPLGLRMTPECSSAFMLIPLLLVTAVFLWLKPQNMKRLFVSLFIACAAIVVVNQGRILTIVGLVEWMGVDRGYYWGHTLLGSLVSVIGGAVALVLFVWLGTRRSKAERRRA